MLQMNLPKVNSFLLLLFYIQNGQLHDLNTAPLVFENTAEGEEVFSFGCLLHKCNFTSNGNQCIAVYQHVNFQRKR